jgi:putative ABC transport system permease protein
VLGHSLLLDGVGYRVIGVIPSGLAFPVHNDAVNYWLPASVDAEPSPWGGSIRKSRGYPPYEAPLARLKPGVTVAQAQAEMSVIAGNVAREHPGADLAEGVRVARPSKTWWAVSVHSCGRCMPRSSAYWR